MLYLELSTEFHIYNFVSGMVNCANIDWFFPWPEQALLAVASVFISPDVSSINFIKHALCHIHVYNVTF